MDRKTLTITLRGEDKIGRKSANRQLRRAGKIPAIIYGSVQPVAVAIDEREFKTQFQRISENTIIQLKGDEKPRDVLVRDWQTDVLTGRVIHIDFYEIEKGRMLHTRVPVRLEGAPIGVKEGGLLESFIHELEVECLPADIPETIVIDVNGLTLGQSLHVSEIQPPAGVRILNPKEQVVCVVALKRAVVEEVPAAAAAEAAAGEEQAPAAETTTEEAE